MSGRVPAVLALATLGAAAWLSSCDAAPVPLCLVDGAELAWPGLRYITAARIPSGVRVRGFSGALAADEVVTVSASSSAREVTQADSRGRFDVSLTTDATTVLLETVDASASLRVRNLDDALACVAGAPAAVGTAPNGLEVARCGADLLAFVPTSGDGALEAAVVAGADGAPTIAFPVDEEGRGANPWAVALHEQGRLGAVTLFGQHAVALVDPCAGTVLDERVALEAPGSQPLLIEVSPAVPLANAMDADGDGERESLVSRMRPRHPEGVAFSEDRLFVAFSNFLEVGPPARYGPGLVVAFDVAGDQLRPAGHTVLPFQNPQSIVVDEDGSPWVSCSGTLERADGRFTATSDGGLVQLDAASLDVTHVLGLGRFSPGTPAIGADWILVGSLLEGSIARLPRGATEMTEGQVLRTGADGIETLFEAASFGGGLVVVTDFSSDALHVVDLEEGILHPWPFREPITVGSGDELFRGLQAVARTPDSALAPGVPEGAALLGLSAEVVPLHFWQVMGP